MDISKLVPLVRHNRYRQLAAAVGLMLIILIGGPIRSSFAATTIYVSTTDDVKKANDGLCSLREAVIAANTDKPSGNRNGECPAGQGADTIILSGETYQLMRTDSGQEDAAATGDLDILDALTLTGAGANATIIEGVDINDRIIDVIGGPVTITGLTVRQGNVPGSGGGIYSEANLILTDVVVSENTAVEEAGGVYMAAGSTLTMSGSTIWGNVAPGEGGGLLVQGEATLTNSTISENTSGSAGGGLLNMGSTTLNYVTIAGNTAVSGSALNTSHGTLSLSNTILAGSCQGTLQSLGYNLLQDGTGCAITGTTTGNIMGQDPLLAPLANNGGPTPTRALLPGSPAVEGADTVNCPSADQRGVSRPIGAYCDMGAYEYENPPQLGPAVTVNTVDDTDDGFCTYQHCTLREAIQAANAVPAIQAITFDIPEVDPSISLTAPLPTLTAPVTIDGTTQPAGEVALDGSQAGGDGLVITAGSSTIRGLQILHFSGNGVVISTNGSNVIVGNVIANNGGSGIVVLDSSKNQLTGNDLFNNGGLEIDLGGDGRSPNDPNDADSGANQLQNFPVLIAAIPASDLTVTGYLNSRANTPFTIELFAGAACGSGHQTYLGTKEIATDADGSSYFRAGALPLPTDAQFVTATATDAQGNTSELADCLSIGPNNTSWPNALELNVAGDLTETAVDQYLDRFGQSRWYKFPIQPNSQVIVTLGNLPANYDLTIYKDIRAAYHALLDPQPEDLALLGTEFAPEVFSPEVFSPEVFSPEVFSPEAYSPEVFSPEVFSPEVFSPEVFSPEVFSPEVFSPEVFSPDAFSPEVFSPEVFSPEVFSPEVFSPEVFSPEVFSSAQVRSLLGASGFKGTASEGIRINTWNHTGYFYVRVRGSNGAYSPQQPFHVSFSMLSQVCNDVQPITTAHTWAATAGSYKTVILTDMARMAGSDAEKAVLQQRLNELAARPEVAGVIVDLGADAKVAAANAQADLVTACPYAKNQVADAVKELVDAYWAQNPLEYVVIVGNDDVVPFFRYADNANLANENNYVPPVRDASASQASLRLGYVLGQDAYGARTAVSFKNSSIPLPLLGVGRLVETAVEATTLLDAYLSTTNGVMTPTTPSLVTGYDFLTDAALAVQAELEAGTAVPAETLIAPADMAPTDPAAWTASDLRAALLGSRHDLTFLAGHFSASGALAADYTTRLTAAELAAAPVDLRNAVIFSAGCHAGYNLVDADGVPLVTEGPDWAQAFAQHGAALIGGTGYQYGDTDYLEYSERLYLTFSEQLRTGTGPVAIGTALAEAKQTYLAETPQMRGIHQKALVEAALFGLPMLQVDMPGQRLMPPGDTSLIGSTTPFASNPGQTLGLTYADLSVTPQFAEHNVQLTNIQDGSQVAATYLSATDGLVTNPSEPVLPLQMLNVGVPNTTLRGVGFRGGSFTDLADVLPLTGAPATEIRGVHAPFTVDYFYPVQMWRANYYDFLADPTGGATRLALTPAQFRSAAPGATTGLLRRYDNLDLRLFYSGNIATYGSDSTPALSAPPTIVQVTAVPANGAVQFQVVVVGNPAAGIQEVWVTYTAVSGSLAGQWQSLDLNRSPDNSTVWQGTLPLNGANPGDIRFIAQAVNGVGLVSMAANVSESYRVDISQNQPDPEPTTLDVMLSTPEAQGAYGSSATFSATLSSGGQPIANQPLTFRLGLQSQQAVTDANGEATVSLTLLGLPGLYTVRVSYAGTEMFAPATAEDTFEITRQDTLLTLNQPAAGYATDDSLLTATLADAAGRRLKEKTVVFVISGTGGALTRAVITDYAGRANLGNLIELPPGEYAVSVYFNGTIVTSTGETLTLDDGRYNPSSALGTLTITPALTCGSAYSSVPTIWPLNKEFVAVNVLGVSDRHGNPGTILITGIYQDEPVKGGNHAIDGYGVGTDTAYVRAERAGSGDGRVYHIFFTASDANGSFCTGELRLPTIGHDQSMDIDAIDGGALYDSTGAN